VLGRFRRSLTSEKLAMTFIPADGDLSDEASVLFKAPATVLEVAVENAIEISHSCGGMGTCGTCCVEVLDGTVKCSDLPERNETEQEIADMRALEPHERLACQLQAVAGLKVRILLK
jgi:ferredoxin, 2Fe-2S